MTKILSICALLVLLAGCARAYTGPQVTAAQAACESRSGIKWLWPDVMSTDRFHVSCNDGSEISGKVKL